MKCNCECRSQHSMRRKAQRGMKAIGTGHSMKHQIIEGSTCFKRTLDALVRVMPTAPTRIVTTSTYKRRCMQART